VGGAAYARVRGKVALLSGNEVLDNNDVVGRVGKDSARGVPELKHREKEKGGKRARGINLRKQNKGLGGELTGQSLTKMGG